MDELWSRVSSKPWLGDEDQALVARIAQDMARLYERAGIEPTPLHVLRVDGLASQVLAVRHLEALVAKWDAPETAGEGDQGAPKGHKAGASRLQLIEALGKVWERVMKMAKEIEEGLGTGGAGKELSLSARVRPLLKKAEGVLEEDLAFEERKRKRQQKAAARSKGSQSA